MFTKGRSPVMRCVQNLQILVRLVVSQNQLGPQSKSNMSTLKSFTRDEWCHHLRPFTIMNFSVFSLSHSRSIEKASTMSKRIQGQKTGEEFAVTKLRSCCFDSRNLLNQKQLFSCGLDASNISGKSQLESGSVQQDKPKPSDVF